MKKAIFLVTAVMMGVLFLTPLYAEDNCAKEEVVKAVNEAVAILESEGRRGLEKVGQIRFCGDNYVFVNDLKGKTLMHLKPHLIGKVLIGLKDDKGKRFFADFTEMAKSNKATKGSIQYYNGGGWVAYRWPRPDEEEFSEKLSYIKGCMMGDENVYVGAGIYK